MMNYYWVLEEQSRKAILMGQIYKITLKQDQLSLNKDGTLEHHPLQGQYWGSKSPAPLTFSGPDLEKSKILDDVNVYLLYFYGGPEEDEHREAWADPIRSIVLQRLCPKGFVWHLLTFEI